MLISWLCLYLLDISPIYRTSSYLPQVTRIRNIVISHDWYQTTALKMTRPQTYHMLILAFFSLFIPARTPWEIVPFHCRHKNPISNTYIFYNYTWFFKLCKYQDKPQKFICTPKKTIYQYAYIDYIYSIQKHFWQESTEQYSTISSTDNSYKKLIPITNTINNPYKLKRLEIIHHQYQPRT